MIVAGTGHRPKYLPCGYDNTHPWKEQVIDNLYEWLEDNQPEKVISGMALGWDTWLAEAALDMGISLTCYIPFKGQELRWRKESQELYNQILEFADEIRYFGQSYNKNLFLMRDKGMVNDCNILLALWNTKLANTGTGTTIMYAEQLGNKKVINFWV